MSITYDRNVENSVVNVAKEIRAAVKRLIDAEVADSWKGGGDPADIPYIEQELEIARMKFDSLMGKLELLKDST